MISRNAHLVLCLACWFADTQLAAASELVPLPKLPDGSIELRTVYLENPRFQTLTNAQLDSLLSESVEAAKEHLGVDIVFTEPVRRSLRDYFLELDRKLEPEAKTQIADFKNGNVDWERITEAIQKSFNKSPARLDELWRFASPHLESSVSSYRTAESLAEALAETMEVRLAFWVGSTAADGHAILMRDHTSPEFSYNEWVYWDHLARLEFPWEVVITNQIVVSAEYSDAGPHAALRGGVTVGGTSASLDAHLGTYSWISVLPFLSNDTMTTKLRRGDKYADAEAISLAGAYLVHELGHQLFHLGHPWENATCAMAPAPLLDFRSWHENLDAEECPFGSSPAMTPGAVKIPTYKRL